MSLNKILIFPSSLPAGTTATAMVYRATLLSIMSFMVLTIVSSKTTQCNRSCGAERVTYPFGFSMGCEFRLSCTTHGKMEFMGFGIRNISSDTLLLNLIASCDRSIDQIYQLFGKNYGPTWRNGLLLWNNCRSSLHRRVVPSSLLEQHFRQSECGGTRWYGDVSYYASDEVGVEILSYKDVIGTGCEFLFSSIVVVSNVLIEFEAVEVAWWLRGTCRCDKNAVCTHVVPASYRCRCNEGFTGDGYILGEGCSNGLSTSGNNGHRRRLLLAVLSGCSGVILLAIFVSLYAFFHRKTREEPISESKFSLPNLSYHTLLQATDGFSSKNLIGKGSSGVVYKGTLDHEDQTIVAVKIFNLEHGSAFRSFMAECQVLRKIRHRNLVKVITTCSGIDYQGKDFKALIFEYMVNGSLEDWLHQKPTCSVDTASDVARELNLVQRLDIATDVAFALEYLHHHCDSPIIHCDLKPSNVLLDDGMVAHVGDFGLAKFLSNSFATSSYANQSISIGVRGTIGYTPPEYGLGNKPSTQGDVFSFGILLLEILTGKRPTDDMFTEGLSLHSFVKAAWPERVMEILDQVLLEDIVGEEMNRIGHTTYVIKTGRSKLVLEALTSVLGIALSCSAELPRERLDMSEVAGKLSSIRNKFPKTTLSPHR